MKYSIYNLSLDLTGLKDTTNWCKNKLTLLKARSTSYEYVIA